MVVKKMRRYVIWTKFISFPNILLNNLGFSKQILISKEFLKILSVFFQKIFSSPLLTFFRSVLVFMISILGLVLSIFLMVKYNRQSNAHNPFSTLYSQRRLETTCCLPGFTRTNGSAPATLAPLTYVRLGLRS